MNDPAAERLLRAIFEAPPDADCNSRHYLGECDCALSQPAEPVQPEPHGSQRSAPETPVAEEPR